MLTLNDRSNNFKQRVARLMGTDRLPATLGNGLGQIIDPLLPLTNVLVRVQSSNGLSTQRSAILPSNANLQMYDGEPILLGYNFRRQYVVIGPDVAGKAAAGISTASVAQQQTSSSTPQVNFETLRLVAKTALTVSLKSWNIILNGTYYEFQFPDIDLTSNVPSSGNMRYALISVLADLSNVEVKNSTQRGVTDVPLGAADVNEAIALLTMGSTPTWAVKLIGDQSVITQSDVDNDAVDLRQIVNANSAGEIKLSSTALVDMNTATATTLYTALTGTIITRVVVRKASTSLTTASYSFGWNSAAFNNVIADGTHTELTGNTLYTILVPKIGATAGVAAGTFKVLMNTLQGGAATTTMDVYGTFV